jgi:hypothetical protein
LLIENRFISRYLASINPTDSQISHEFCATSPRHPLAGDSLPVCLHRIKEMSVRLKQAEIVFHPLLPLSTDILVELPNAGIRLRFNAVTQALALIDCFDLSKLCLTKDGQAFCGPDVAATFALVYRAFGPTFPGKSFENPANFATFAARSFPSLAADANKAAAASVFALQYPGVALLFPMPDEKTMQTLAAGEASSESAAASLAGGGAASAAHAPHVSRLLCFCGPDIENRLEPTPAYLRAAVANAALSTVPAPMIFYQQPVQVLPGIGIQLTAQHVWLTFDLHAQDVIAELGPPDRIFRKPVATSGGSNSTLHGPSQLGASVSIRSRPPSPLVGSSVMGASASMSQSPKIVPSSPLLLPAPHSPLLLAGVGAPLDALPRAINDGHAANPGHGDYTSAEEGFRDYAFNYFGHGLDIVLDGGTHAIKKIVLHTNFPACYNFNMYQKCHFRLLFPASGGNASASSDAPSGGDGGGLGPQFVVSALDANSHWDSIKAQLGPCSRPLVNPFGAAAACAPVPFIAAAPSALHAATQTHVSAAAAADEVGGIAKMLRLDGSSLYAYPNMIFEVMQNGYLASVQLMA